MSARFGAHRDKAFHRTSTPTIRNFGPLGVLMAASGFWEEGTSLAEEGIALTAPSTPRWWWWATAERHWFAANIRWPWTHFGSRSSSSSRSVISRWHTRCRSSARSMKRERMSLHCWRSASIHGQRADAYYRGVVLRLFLSRGGGAPFEPPGCRTPRSPSNSRIAAGTRSVQGEKSWDTIVVEDFRRARQGWIERLR